MMKSFKYIFLAAAFVALLSSCHSGKKCNGQRGTRVEMGTMQADHRR